MSYKYKFIDYNNEINSIDQTLLYKAVLLLGQIKFLEQQKNNFDFNKFRNISKLLSNHESLSNATIEGSPVTYEELLISDIDLNKKENLLFEKNKEYAFTLDFQRILEINNIRKTIDKFTKYRDKNLYLSDIKFMHKMLFEWITNKEIFSGEFIGEFRKKEATIRNRYIGKIIYVACPAEKLERELILLDSIVQNTCKNEAEFIVNSAIMHAWFERIHPFGDGNGRVGRLIIPFYFVKHNITNTPILFISSEIAKSENRIAYNYQLENIGKNESYTDFINWYIKIFIDYCQSFIEFNFLYDKKYKELKNNIQSIGKKWLNDDIDFYCEFLLVNTFVTTKKIMNDFNAYSKRKKLKLFNVWKTIIPVLLKNNLIKIYDLEKRSKTSEGTIVYESLVKIEKFK